MPLPFHVGHQMSSAVGSFYRICEFFASSAGNVHVLILPPPPRERLNEDYAERRLFLPHAALAVDWTRKPRPGPLQSQPGGSRAPVGCHRGRLLRRACRFLPRRRPFRHDVSGEDSHRVRGEGAGDLSGLSGRPCAIAADQWDGCRCADCGGRITAAPVRPAGAQHGGDRLSFGLLPLRRRAAPLQ